MEDIKRDKQQPEKGFTNNGETGNAGDNSSKAGQAKENRAAGGTGGTGGTTKERIPKLVMVDIPEGVEVEAEAPQPKKPKKKAAPKKKTKRLTKKEQEELEATQELEQNISILLKTCFDLVALKTSPIWQVSQEECNGIAAPLSRIMQRHDMTEKANAYSDYIALGVAATITVVPRVILMQQEKRAKGVKEVVNANNQSRQTQTINPKAARTNGTTPDNNNNIKELLPAII